MQNTVLGSLLTANVWFVATQSTQRREDMIGNIWSAGITVKSDGKGKWKASLYFRDTGFCEDGMIEGSLTTCHFEPLAQAIDTIKTDAERLGIQIRGVGGSKPFLFGELDGNNEKWPMPDDWVELLREQVDRLGWSTYRDPPKFTPILINSNKPETLDKPIPSAKENQA